MTIDAFRFYNTVAGGHFFTVSPQERDAVIQNLPQFNYEGVGFDTVHPSEAGSVAIYRFYNTQAGGHFFTADVAERDNVIANLPQYSYEGVGFSAPNPGAAGAAPVYRFYNTQAGGHFFTANVQERDTVINTLSHMNYEGVGFYEANPFDYAAHDMTQLPETQPGPYGQWPKALYTSTLGNLLVGGEGVDHLLNISSPPSTMWGQAGDDFLMGGDEADTLHGGPGNDTIRGKWGHDTMWGGPGNDIFVVDRWDGADIIMDFQPGDRIHFTYEAGEHPPGRPPESPGFQQVYTDDPNELIFVCPRGSASINFWNLARSDVSWVDDAIIFV